MNLKPKCLKCKKELVYYRMVLMIGPKEYRRYPLCDRCAAEVEKKTADGGRLAVGRRKAGV